MKDIVQNLVDQGKKDEAEWMEKCIRILVENFSRMGSAFLPRQIMDTTHSFHVNKNWNSHGSQVGATMCQLGSILASFEDASNRRLVSMHFSEVIPRGCVQMGTKHGNHDITYAMCLHSCLCCHGDLCSLALSERASSWRLSFRIYQRPKLVPQSRV